MSLPTTRICFQRWGRGKIPLHLNFESSHLQSSRWLVIAVECCASRSSDSSGRRRREEEMAFQLPNLSMSLLLLQTTTTKSSLSIQQQQLLHHHHHHHQTSSLLHKSPSLISYSSISPVTKLETPPPISTSAQQGSSSSNGNNNNNNKEEQQQQQKRNDFYVNLGVAVRTLREDMPLLFTKDLNYDIYRDDITFIDPMNTFTGIEKYKLIFWALRFHGRVLFRDISLEVFRVWQPSENVILIRWNLRGVPRVPWEAKGQFQGTSRYKLDRNGKIYEHKVDNLAFNFPKQLRPALSVLDLVAASPATPNPTFSLWGSPTVECSASWLEFYRSVRATVVDWDASLLGQEGLLTCS